MTLQPATATPFLQNSSVAQSYRRLTISSTSTGSTPINAQLSRSSQQPEKMAASLLAPPPLSQLAELNLSAVPKAVLYSLGTDSSLLRELPLLWGVDKLMEVIPTGWKKVLTSVHHSVTLHTHIHTHSHTYARNSHTYTHIHTHIHTYAHSYTSTHTHTHTHIHTLTYIHTYTHTHTHTYTHTHTHTHIHTLIHTHTHSHTYTHTYTHTHPHTLTHIYTYIHSHTECCVGAPEKAWSGVSICSVYPRRVQ